MKKKFSTRKKCLFALIAVGCVLVLSEFTFLVLEWIAASKEKPQEEKMVLVPPRSFEAYTMFDNEPGYRSKNIQIDNMRFRSPPITKEKPEDVFRVFLLGGSTSVGYGSRSNDETITGILAKILKDKHPQKKCEVVNAGVSSFNSTQELIQLHSKILSFDPDYVVVLDGRNDFYYSTRQSWKPHINRFAEDIGPIIDKKDDINIEAILRLSATYRGIQELSKDTSFPVNNYIAPYRQEVVDIWAKNISYMDELMDAEGVGSYFIIQPSIARTAKTLSKQEHHILKQLSRIGHSKNYVALIAKMHEEAAKKIPELRQQNINISDAVNVFRKEMKTVFLDECHLVALGNYYLAMDIYKQLAKHPHFK